MVRANQYKLRLYVKEKNLENEQWTEKENTCVYENYCNEKEERELKKKKKDNNTQL